MKTFIISTVFLTLVNNSFSNEIKWVDKQIKAIKPDRIGIDNSKINSINDPFVFIVKTKKSQKKVNQTTYKNKKSSKSLKNQNTLSDEKKFLVINAIINDSVLINGKWYKLKDKVGKYTINKIERKTVYLKSKSKKLLLTIKNKNKKIKFKH